MFYLPLGYFAAHNPAYAAAAEEFFGIGADKLEVLNVPNLLLNNLLPVTIGNIIGGSVILAGFYYLALKKYK